MAARREGGHAVARRTHTALRAEGEDAKRAAAAAATASGSSRRSSQKRALAALLVVRCYHVLTGLPVTAGEVEMVKVVAVVEEEIVRSTICEYI